MCPHIRTLLVISVLLAASYAAMAETTLFEIDEAVDSAEYGRALEMINRQLATTPQDTSLRFRQAQVYSYIGDYEKALHTLTSLHREYPNDVDYVFARAQVLAWLGRDDESLSDLRQAVALAPEYEDVWELRYNLLSRQQDAGTDLEREAVRQEAATRFPGASWWQEDESELAASWTVLIGAGHENLSNGLPAWDRQFIEVTRDHGSFHRLRMGIGHDRRFDNSDLALSLGGDAYFASNWAAGLDLAFSDQADFLPDYSYSAYLGRSLHRGWSMQLSYRRREYATATVGTATGIVEKYINDFRVAYTLGSSHLHGKSNFLNHGLTINWYYNDLSSVGITFNTGNEAESIGSGRVLVTEVRGVSVTGRRRMSDRLNLFWWLGLHDQGDLYRRQYFGMAVEIRI